MRVHGFERLTGWALVGLLAGLCGCPATGSLPDGSDNTTTNPPDPPDGGDGSDGGDPDGGLTVDLRVSNPTPRANETVILTCRVTSGGSAGVTYGFDPDTRLLIRADTGTASLIVLESDVGTTLTFRCSADTEDGGHGVSDPVLVTPSS